MNNYSNMNYFMPNIQDDFSYLNNQMPNFYNQKPQNNIQKDTNLINKLKVQAGDNMNFNKSNFKQTVDPNNLYDAYNGFIRGNMFPDLYNQYKISKPFEVTPANKQAEMLTYLDAYCFAAHDLNLYLDTHPNDKTAIELFKEYTNQKEKIQKEYEQTYGPLFVDASTTYPWAWNDSPWPWENR